MNYTCRYPVISTDGSAPNLEGDTRASRGCCSTTEYSMSGYSVLYEGVFHSVKRTLPVQIFGDTSCHPERSEGSGSLDGEILRCAQDDSLDTSLARERKKWIEREERRRWDLNPRRLFTLHDFQSCSLDHYETPPCRGMMVSHARRREWDSNPRGLSPYRFSRAAHSTTLTSLRCAV